MSGTVGASLHDLLTSVHPEIISILAQASLEPFDGNNQTYFQSVTPPFIIDTCFARYLPFIYPSFARHSQHHLATITDICVPSLSPFFFYPAI
jgi:hypothetical protein